MAYLTKAILKHFEYNYDVEEHNLLDFFLKYIYDDIMVYEMFNKLEIKGLLIQCFLFEPSMRNEMVISLKQAKEISDDFTTIYTTEGKPKYHYYRNCPKLNNAYFNFEAPEEFKVLIRPENLEKHLNTTKKELSKYKNRLNEFEKSPNKKNMDALNEYEDEIKKYERTDDDENYRKEAISELRKWFIDNNYTRKGYENTGKTKENFAKEISENYNKNFVKANREKYKYIGLKIVSESYFLAIIRDNSGVEEIDYRNIDKLVEIEKKKSEIREKEQLKYNLCKDIGKKHGISVSVLYDLSRKDFLVNKGDYEILELLKNLKIKREHFSIIKELLSKYKEIKELTREYLIDLMKIKYGFNNSNENFDDFLQDFGFECCNTCINRRYNKVFEGIFSK